MRSIPCFSSIPFEGTQPRFTGSMPDRVLIATSSPGLFYWSLSVKNNQNPRKCCYCSNPYTPKSSRSRYCSPECKTGRQKERVAQNVIREQHISSFYTSNGRLRTVPKRLRNIPIGLTNFSGLWFHTEKQFVEWFSNNYVLFGLEKIDIIRTQFPDVIATTYSGVTLRIELELNASNFLMHGHDSKMCDLIISFLKSPNIFQYNDVPIVSVFDFSEYSSVRALTDFFQGIILAQQEKMENIVSKLGLLHSPAGDL